MKRRPNPRVDTALLGVLLVTLILGPATIGTVWIVPTLAGLALVGAFTAWRHR